MRRTKRSIIFALAVLTVLSALLICPSSPGWAQPYLSEVRQPVDGAIRIEIKPLPKGISRIFLVSTPDGRRQFEMIHIDGTVERLSSEAFAERVYSNQQGKPWLYRMLNISSPIGFAWVCLGLLGQVLFTGRALLQWFVSEKAKRSIVPVGYWWMSLIGASMLLVYFIWRRDIVGVLGLSTGWLIYARNLWLIHFQQMNEVEPRIESWMHETGE